MKSRLALIVSLRQNHEQLAEIGRHHLIAMQKLPIGNPDPIPKRKYIVQMKEGLQGRNWQIGPSLPKRGLKRRNNLPKRGKARPATPEDDNGVRLIPDTPPGATLSPEGESQGGTTISLVLGSPRPVPPPPVPSFRGSPSPGPRGDLLRDGNSQFG